MTWSDGRTELELNTDLILVSSLPFHLAPRPVHHVEVVVGLLAPCPRNVGVSPVETQWSPPVSWRPRPPVRPPRYGRSREVGDVAGYDAIERVTEVHEVARHETWGTRVLNDQSTWAISSPTLTTSSYHTKMHSTIHLTVQYNTHLTEYTVRTRFILKLPVVLRMRVPTITLFLGLAENLNILPKGETISYTFYLWTSKILANDSSRSFFSDAAIANPFVNSNMMHVYESCVDHAHGDYNFKEINEVVERSYGV